MRRRCASIVLFSVLTLAMAVLAETPRLISYQGRLTDASGEPLEDGAKNLRFIIWNDPTSVAPEQRPGDGDHDRRVVCGQPGAGADDGARPDVVCR
jgi:hypothetical protein